MTQTPTTTIDLLLEEWSRLCDAEKKAEENLAAARRAKGQFLTRIKEELEHGQYEEFCRRAGISRRESVNAKQWSDATSNAPHVELLDRALPTVRAQNAFAAKSTPISVRRQIIDEAMDSPDKIYSEADVKNKVLAAKASVAIELEKKHQEDHAEMVAELERLSKLEKLGKDGFDPVYARNQRVARIGNHLVMGLAQIEADIKSYLGEKKHYHQETQGIIDRQLKSLKNTIITQGRL